MPKIGPNQCYHFFEGLNIDRKNTINVTKYSKKILKFISLKIKKIDLFLANGWMKGLVLVRFVC